MRRRCGVGFTDNHRPAQSHAARHGMVEPPEAERAQGGGQAHFERRVAVQLEHAKVDVVAAERACEDGEADPDALVAGPIRVGARAHLQAPCPVCDQHLEGRGGSRSAGESAQQRSGTPMDEHTSRARRVIVCGPGGRVVGGCRCAEASLQQTGLCPQKPTIKSRPSPWRPPGRAGCRRARRSRTSGAASC